MREDGALSLTSWFPLAEGGMGDWIVLPLIIFVIFYFILIRPASREKRVREAQMAALKKHDRVITNAGIHGTVVALEDDAVILRVDDKNNVRMKFSRAAIWQINPTEKAGGEKAAEAREKRERAEAETASDEEASA